MAELWQDLRYGARVLTKSPLVSLVAIGSLAAGIAANAVVFSVTNSLLLEPFPYEDQDELVLAFTSNRNDPGTEAVPAADYLDWREATTSFSGTAAYTLETQNLTGLETPEQVQAGVVTPGLFRLVGVRPALGRDFRREEGAPGRNDVVILHHSYWQRQFAGDPGVLNSELTLDGTRYTVIGVMPEEFDLIPATTDLFRPTDLSDQRENRGERNWLVLGRLKPGVSVEAAESELSGIARRLEERYPETNAGYGVDVDRIRDWFPGPTDTKLLGIITAVTLFVLLIACANVANLLLSRAEARQKEVAIRTALGAGRGRLLRQLLTEAVLLAVVAGGVGIALSIWGVKGLAAAFPPEIPTAFLPDLDGMVLLATVGVSVLAGIIFGIAPSLHAVRGEMTEALGEGSRGGTAGRKRKRLRSIFVVGQVAVALAMLTGSGLLMDAMEQAIRANSGFDARGVLTFRVSLPEHTYGGDQEIAAFYREAVRRLDGIPGATGVAAMTSLPRGRNNPSTPFTIDGRPRPEPNQEPTAFWQSVNPDYFSTLGARIRRGRGFEPFDRAETSPVVVVNQAFVDRHFDDDDPIGHRITVRGESREIVGVVENITHSRIPPQSGPEPALYLPMAQAPIRTMSLALRAASGSPGALSGPARSAIWTVDPDLPVGAMRSLEAHIAESLSGPRAIAIMLGIFGGLALLLSAIGIYGVIAHSITQRTREIGIRIALGAESGKVVGMVTRQGLVLATLGLLIGAPLSFAVYLGVRSAMTTFVAVNPLLMGVIAGVLAVVALGASYLPARRAARVEPVRALQVE